ncbi:MAG: hypothetical protein LBT00_08770 [Spirochaetaceae bacterium]|jgi:hypothetical protein|nr:hypothetical protein [Spirochaetaceae bacterium]
MTKKTLMILAVALCATISAFAGGNKEGVAASASSLAGDNISGTAGGTALRSRAGGWEDIDGLSSASILRVDRSKFGYIDKNGMDGYRIKIVDVSDPAKTVREGLVGGSGRNVAMWAAGTDGRIVLVEADELGRQDYTGYNIVVYDQDLQPIKSFPYGNQVGLAEAHRARPLNHREPIIALTDRYAIAGWQDKSPVDTDPAPNFISIYSLEDDKAGHIPVSGDTVHLNIGNLTGFAAQGDYIIVGGSAGTKVLRINASGQAITAAVVDSVPQTPGSHWIQDNRNYVLESVEGNGTVRVWKWNGANAPSLVGVVTADATSGSVQAVSFDNDNPGEAYLLGKVANANAGNVYRIDLATAQALKLFTIPDVVAGGALTGMWTIQVESSGADTWYIVGGAIGTAPNDKNGVLVIKNPPLDGSSITAAHLSASLLDFPTPARSMKAFKSSGNIVYVTKNHMSRNYPVFSRYMLRAMSVNGN